MTILSKEEYLELVEHYLYKYTGQYVQSGDAWIELRTPRVSWKRGTAGRTADAMEDDNGDLWFIREDLETMEPSYKLLPLDKLPPNAKVIGRSR